MERCDFMYFTLSSKHEYLGFSETIGSKVSRKLYNLWVVLKDDNCIFLK